MYCFFTRKQFLSASYLKIHKFLLAVATLLCHGGPEPVPTTFLAVPLSGSGFSKSFVFVSSGGHGLSPLPGSNSHHPLWYQRRTSPASTQGWVPWVSRTSPSQRRNFPSGPLTGPPNGYFIFFFPFLLNFSSCLNNFPIQLS